MVVARRASVSGSTTTAIASTMVATAKTDQDAIQSARAWRRRSGRDSSGGANQRKIECEVSTARSILL